MLRLFICIVMTIGCIGCSPAEDMRITDAWIQAMPPSRDVTAAYLVIENRSDRATALVAGETDAAETVEMHTMEYAEDMMKMRQVDRIEILAQSKTALEPGAFHLMLFGVRRQLAEGDSVSLTLRFTDRSPRTVIASVRKTVPRSPKTRPSH